MTFGDNWLALGNFNFWRVGSLLSLLARWVRYELGSSRSITMETYYGYFTRVGQVLESPTDWTRCVSCLCSCAQTLVPPWPVARRAQLVMPSVPSQFQCDSGLFLS